MSYKVLYIFNSTISAGMNALAAVCITDFIRPAYLILKKKPIDERFATIVTKGLGIISEIAIKYPITFYWNILISLSFRIRCSCYRLCNNYSIPRRYCTSTSFKYIRPPRWSSTRCYFTWNFRAVCKSFSSRFDNTFLIWIISKLEITLGGVDWPCCVYNIQYMDWIRWHFSS